MTLIIMKLSIILIYMMVTTNAISKDAWELVQVNRHNNIQSKEKNIEDAYSITMLKSGGSDSNSQTKDSKEAIINSGYAKNDATSNFSYIDEFTKDANNLLNKLGKTFAGTSNNSPLTNNEVNKIDSTKATEFENTSEKVIPNHNLISTIGNSSIKIVIFNGENITRAYAENIVATISKHNEAVIIFGIEESTENLKYIEDKLKIKKLYYNEAYVLPKNVSLLCSELRDLENITYSFRAYVPFNKLCDELYQLVNDEKYTEAVRLSKSLLKHKNDLVLPVVILRLIEDANDRIMSYTYKLWDNDAKNIVNLYFPSSFKKVFNEEEVKIVYKKSGALSLASTKTDLDRFLYTDCTHNDSAELIWSFIPVWRNNKISFKIKNEVYNMYIKLQYNADLYGDRIAWGATSKYFQQVRFRWYLVPLFDMEGNIQFCIRNSEYDQILTSSHCTNENQDVLGTTSWCLVDSGWYLAEVDHSDSNSTEVPLVSSMSERAILQLQAEEHNTRYTF
ncbi:uncharacterized protein LOC126371477 [Pectinophora gossypiella]|uniref:uncharacterized protein LOC126371477 n=1 Tax=Pectinophora gossypiella TaxID=13191 RepID=UPI00214E33B1|nr:uncharacterized protein LOC126371477 [Pectinophora gossypiella]